MKSVSDGLHQNLQIMGTENNHHRWKLNIDKDQTRKNLSAKGGLLNTVEKTKCIEQNILMLIFVIGIQSEPFLWVRNAQHNLLEVMRPSWYESDTVSHGGIKVAQKYTWKCDLVVWKLSPEVHMYESGHLRIWKWAKSVVVLLPSRVKEPKSVRLSPNHHCHGVVVKHLKHDHTYK